MTALVLATMVLAPAGGAQSQTGEPTRTRPPRSTPADGTRSPRPTREPRTPPPATRIQERREESLDKLRQRGLEAIDRRLDQLARLRTQVDKAKHLRSADRDALVVQLDVERDGLAALADEIRGAQDTQTLRPLVRSIVDKYRVYMLMEPKVRLVISADRLLSAADMFDILAAKLQDRIDAAEASGTDTSDAQTALDAMRTNVEAARAAVEPVPGMIIPLRPTDHPGNRGFLRDARRSLQTGREALRDAHRAGKDAVQALKAASRDNE